MAFFALNKPVTCYIARLPFVIGGINGSNLTNMDILAPILSLSTFLLLFSLPFIQMFQVRKRIKGRSECSILSITLLTMLTTFVFSIVALVISEVAMSLRTVIVKCDMTIPAVIGIDFFLIIIVIPLIGIIGGAVHYFRDKQAI